MQFAEAHSALEEELVRRARAGRSVEIEAIGCEAGNSTCVLVYVWIFQDAEPITLLVHPGFEVVEETLPRHRIVSLLFNPPAAPPEIDDPAFRH